MKSIFVSGVCLLSLFCCSSCQNNNAAQSAWSSVDSWYRPAPANISLHSNSGQLQEQNPTFVEVSDAFEKQAETLLLSKSAVLVSMAQATQMSEGKYHASKNKPFLVRAVYLNKPTGAFDVVRTGNDLFVQHSCLGRTGKPMRRQVLIVDLPQTPRTVYTDCSMAE